MSVRILVRVYSMPLPVGSMLKSNRQVTVSGVMGREVVKLE